MTFRVGLHYHRRMLIAPCLGFDTRMGLCEQASLPWPEDSDRNSKRSHDEQAHQKEALPGYGRRPREILRIVF